MADAFNPETQRILEAPNITQQTSINAPGRDYFPRWIFLIICLTLGAMGMYVADFDLNGGMEGKDITKNIESEVHSRGEGLLGNVLDDDDAYNDNGGPHDGGPNGNLREADQHKSHDGGPHDGDRNENLRETDHQTSNDEGPDEGQSNGNLREIYQHKSLRKSPLGTEQAKSLAQTYGKWTFVDPRKDKRPKQDYFISYPNRDIPRDKFPENAWQTDPEYLSKFLPEAIALVERAMEAILSEYGFGLLDKPTLPFDSRVEQSPFKFSIIVLDEVGHGKKKIDGSFTTKGSFDVLTRRVLHTIMSEDKFTLVMGGHSAAAGHGNHFQQSYTMQFYRVIEPVLARFGVRHIAHNIANGGLGTMQHSLCSRDVYGKDIDILHWDSGMTEKDPRSYELFARQAILGGDRVPSL